MRRQIGSALQSAATWIGVGPAAGVCALLHIGYSRQPTAVIGPFILGGLNLVVTAPLWLPLQLLGRAIEGPRFNDMGLH